MVSLMAMYHKVNMRGRSVGMSEYGLPDNIGYPLGYPCYFLSGVRAFLKKGFPTTNVGMTGEHNRGQTRLNFLQSFIS